MTNELLEPKYWSVKQLFDSQYYIPVYQRPYSWKTEQVDSLLDDILNAYNEYKNLDEDERYKSILYIGNMILHSKKYGSFDIIDGQQRITTLSLIMLALYAKCSEYNIDISDRILQKLQAAIWKLDGADNPIKEKRVITLGSVDKEFFEKILDYAYECPEDLKKFILQYDTKNSFENNLKDNFIRIYDFLNERFNESGELLLFSNYILIKINLIAIIVSGSEVKAFSIFESINSKGKKLEDIDLIKTYIFSNLKELDYASYLSKWGSLIVKTNDQLYDYLKVYIKANVKFFSQNISFYNFKKLDNEICKHFNVSKLEDAYKKLIDDMLDKVVFYNALSNVDKMIGIIKDKKFKFYYSMYIKMGYEHPAPLFFRCLTAYNYGNGTISKEDVITIFIEIIKLMISFLTISQKDSKDIINVFSSILEEIYSANTIVKDSILYKINAKLQTSGIRNEDLSSSLMKLDLYDKNKKLGAALISIYESKTNDGNISLSWDEAYAKFSTYGSAYSLDHIMNQTPDKLDPNLKYFKLGNNLKLKEIHDFPTELVHEGMEYDTFKSLILHKIGNLRLKGLDGNSARQNESDVTFCTYSNLEARSKKITEFVMKNLLNFKKVSNNYIPISETNKKKTMVGNFDLSMESLDLTNSKAKTLTIFDREYDLSYNKDILKNVVMYFYENNEIEMVSMARNNWKPRNRIIIANDKSVLKEPFEIVKNEIYVETNLSSKDIIWYSKELFNIFNFPLDLVIIYIPD